VLRTHRLRWALLCVAATYGTLLATSAEASRTVVIKPGDSIDSLARKFHVSTRDIARANGISTEALLIDGKKLIIPDPPKTVVKEATMRHAATIRGDRIAVRRGPHENYRRITLLDEGESLVVTRKAGDWFQVKLESGAVGWVRGEFLALGGSARAAASSSHTREPLRTASRKTSRDEEASAAAHRKRHARSETRTATRHRKTQVAAHRRSRHIVRYARRHRSRPEADAPEADSDVVRTAYAYRGTPYHYGGSSRRGFDCSGFTSYVYGRKGVSLPHSAAEQFQNGRKVSGSQIKPGDLVFFHTTRRGISHVGIYAGDGKFVHASSGGGSVRVDSLNSGYYKNRFRGARRVK
jgi:cell wall-associated NlpC family hydrolase